LYFNHILIKRTPSSARHANNLAVTLHSLGRHSEAIILLRRIRREKPQYRHAALVLADILVELGQLRASYRSEVGRLTHGKCSLAMRLWKK
jgi:predicted Zn-dependent protease